MTYHSYHNNGEHNDGRNGDCIGEGLIDPQMDYSRPMQFNQVIVDDNGIVHSYRYVWNRITQQYDAIELGPEYKGGPDTSFNLYMVMFFVLIVVVACLMSMFM